MIDRAILEISYLYVESHENELLSSHDDDKMGINWDPPLAAHLYAPKCTQMHLSQRY
jgi:hypothetical protein